MNLKEMLESGATVEELRESFEKQIADAQKAIEQDMAKEAEAQRVKREADARHTMVMAAIQYMSLRGYLTTEEVKAAIENSEEIEAELKELEEEYVPYIRILKDVLEYAENKEDKTDDIIERFLKGLE